MPEGDAQPWGAPPGYLRGVLQLEKGFVVPLPVPKAGLNAALLAHLSLGVGGGGMSIPNIPSSAPSMAVLESPSQPTTLGLNHRVWEFG